MIVGILTARNMNRPTPASVSPPTIKVLKVPTSADWVPTFDAAPSRTPLREKPRILDRSTAI